MSCVSCVYRVRTTFTLYLTRSTHADFEEYVLGSWADWGTAGNSLERMPETRSPDTEGTMVSERNFSRLTVKHYIFIWLSVTDRGPKA